MSKKFIDVSKYQGNINVGKYAKENGYSGVIIKSGAGVGIDDSKMEEYVKSCIDNNVKYGFYHYGYIGYSSTNTAKNEANYFIDLVEKYYYDGIPLAYDLEEDYTKSDNDVYDFCNIVQSKFPKAYVMIYTNLNHMSRLNIDPNKYALWLARPNQNYANDTGVDNICAKQYHFGEHGGTLGNIDLNADYKDIFNIIKPTVEYIYYDIKAVINDDNEVEGYIRYKRTEKDRSKTIKSYFDYIGSLEFDNHYTAFLKQEMTFYKSRKKEVVDGVEQWTLYSSQGKLDTGKQLKLRAAGRNIVIK